VTQRGTTKPMDRPSGTATWPFQTVKRSRPGLAFLPLPHFQPETSFLSPVFHPLSPTVQRAQKLGFWLGFDHQNLTFLQGLREETLEEELLEVKAEGGGHVSCVW
jgi:hypothetical protein